MRGIIAEIKLSDFRQLTSVNRRLSIKWSDVWSKSQGVKKLTKALWLTGGPRSSQRFLSTKSCAAAFSLFFCWHVTLGMVWARKPKGFFRSVAKWKVRCAKHLLLFYRCPRYSATTWTGPLQTKLANRSINWEQRTAPFLVNRPVKPKNGNNGLTTKIWNSTKLPRIADVSETLSVFDWFVSILFFKTFFDFSTFQTVSVNYKILTIFSTMTFAHCIQLKLNWVGGIYDIPTATRACFWPSPRWNESTVSWSQVK